ncbi:PQQ-dependent sugar dehydrogenase [Spirosoma endbachense]|uniref:Glucose/Sorbosone dehydrogenase domain-containing protein n=1 Tax=Spirosoma endbachense TaxID=2666025 RepID=A0A6P1VZS3_9BACT|nr:PQQ-dependent sugar dehydrogenase [Spirosoma endbachense]QHV96906.1 hypothetical protein GJR95_18675 [Spirosoma endbachense]
MNRPQQGSHSLTRTAFCLQVVLVYTFMATHVCAQSFPANFTQVAVATGLSAPTIAAFSPDGRIFVAQQSGQLRVVKNGSLLPTPFVELTVDASGERGLLGIAFDPDFATNQHVYLYYTVPTSGTVTVHNRISRFTVSGDVALSGSELILLELDALSGATNHNGGSMVFGADGKLYIGVGENANPANSQYLDNYLGKVLRINTDGSVPAGNPYTSGSEARKRIWAYGLRNPYTLAVQPVTGRFFVNDVGQETWEEINDASTGGLNFGWPTAEGTSSNPAFTNPVFKYPHAATGNENGCAITGGSFYNPTEATYPASYVGRYFYQDFCNNWINMLDLSGPSPVRSTLASGLPGFSVGLTAGIDGNLYYLSRGTGTLYEIIYTANNICQSLKDGNWHDTSVWSCGRIPTSADKTTVRHAVTVATNQTGQTLRVSYQVGGRVLFAGGAQLRLGE